MEVTVQVAVNDDSTPDFKGIFYLDRATDRKLAKNFDFASVAHML
jgi:hypothetical protein